MNFEPREGGLLYTVVERRVAIQGLFLDHMIRIFGSIFQKRVCFQRLLTQIRKFSLEDWNYFRGGLYFHNFLRGFQKCSGEIPGDYRDS